MYIRKVSNNPSDLDAYLSTTWMFIGAVIALANSMILVLSSSFEKKGFRKINNGMLGPYIAKFEQIIKDPQLIDDLKEYNVYLNLVKHSVSVSDKELIKRDNKIIKLLDIKTSKIYEFNETKQGKIFTLASSIIDRINQRLSEH